jgi:hypothetical protein
VLSNCTGEFSAKIVPSQAPLGDLMVEVLGKYQSTCPGVTPPAARIAHVELAAHTEDKRIAGGAKQCSAWKNITTATRAADRRSDLMVEPSELSIKDALNGTYY